MQRERWQEEMKTCILPPASTRLGEGQERTYMWGQWFLIELLIPAAKADGR